MVFSWFRDHHRRSILEQPFPAEWLSYLTNNVKHYALLTPDEQQEMREDIQIFIAEKYWEGVGSMEITEEIQVTIAAQACLLVLHREHDYFPNVESILVYPTGYSAKETSLEPGGIQHETLSERLGEAWSSGPVILSWADVLAGGRNDNDGRNVVYHEFAHKLDMRDGAADGVPRLADEEAFDYWEAVMNQEYQQLVDQSEHGKASLLNTYAATNPAEFFAVATEVFFEKAHQMQQTHPALYGVLSAFYQQDPANRATAHHSETHAPIAEARQT